ncbi:Hypothetical predicted protein [Cloeon dipterum]|uniref:Uncharacterized protein n=1 Tax=Cloeon dipterum TaxID=197152 RepID=A0A8S1DYQ2_9INSE|nr:Hypothetical predicted protein [Cloeon dipterum]
MDWLSDFIAPLRQHSCAMTPIPGPKCFQWCYSDYARSSKKFFKLPQRRCSMVSHFASLKRMAKLRPAPVKAHGEQKVFVYQNLATCPFVYLRTDFVRKPLQAPYTGPHKVLERSLNQRLYQLNKTSQPLRGPKSPKNPFLLTKNNHGWSIAISRGQRKNVPSLQP